MVETMAKQPVQALEIVKVARADLPLSCPQLGTEVWNLHPRVYLPIETGSETLCPYCGTHYVLEG